MCRITWKKIQIFYLTTFPSTEESSVILVYDGNDWLEMLWFIFILFGKFYFPLVWGIIMCNIEFETKEIIRVVTKISSYWVFVVSSRGSHKQPWRPPHPQEVFEVQLLPFSKRYSRPKKAIFIKSTAIISRFMMITFLLKKTTTFWDTKIISFYFA